MRKGSKPQLDPLEAGGRPSSMETAPGEAAARSDVPPVNLAAVQNQADADSPQPSARDDQTPRNGVPSIELARRRRLNKMMKPPKAVSCTPRVIGIKPCQVDLPHFDGVLGQRQSVRLISFMRTD